jgi:hypothetical protein
MALGRRIVEKPGQKPRRATAKVNTRTALWTERWPAIALQACIDEVEKAPPEDRARVKRELPCQDCPKNTACLNAKRKEIGPLLYDREILTKPRSSESSLFPREMFDPMLNPNRSMTPFYVKSSGLERYEFVVSGWDLAWSEKVGGDHLVRSTGVVDLRNGRKRLINIHRYPQGLTYTQQCTLIAADHQKFREDVVVIEADAAQGWDFPYMEDGLGYDEMESLLTEFEAFGWVDGKLEGVGEHDDMVMAYWHMWWGMRLMGQTIDEFYNGNQPGRQE